MERHSHKKYAVTALLKAPSRSQMSHIAGVGPPSFDSGLRFSLLCSIPWYSNHLQNPTARLAMLSLSAENILTRIGKGLVLSSYDDHIWKAYWIFKWYYGFNGDIKVLFYVRLIFINSFIRVMLHKNILIMFHQL